MVDAPRPPLWILVLLALTGTLAMHMFVPALPFAAADLGVGVAAIQLSIGVHILTMAVGQIFCGPISDALGRRPVVNGGIVLFIAGSLLCAFAPTLPLLLAGRVLQALGGAAGLTMARAVVRDVAGAAGSQRDIALLNLLMLIGPAISPVIGSWVTVGLGWRAIFLVLGLGALILFALVQSRWPETAPARSRFDLREILRRLTELMGRRAFACTATGGALSSTLTYGYYAAAPFILTDLGVAPANVGWFIGGVVGGAILGTALTRWSIGRVRRDTILTAGSLLALLAGGAFLALAIFGQLTPMRIFAATFTMMFAAGGISPTSLSLALDLEPQRAGAAAGFFGAAQMALGALSTALVGIGPRSDLACGIVLFGGAAVSLILLRAGRRGPAQWVPG